MWVAVAGGLVRTFGAAFAGWLVAQGGIGTGDAQAIVGALGTLLVAGASVADKVKRKGEK
jgi:hypothetical protein